MTGTVSGGGAGGCCFDEVPFERMVQCDESHLFCDTCIERLAQEAAFGTAPPILACMHTDGCTATFPNRELRRTLKQDVYDKLIDRQVKARACVRAWVMQ
eukprot:m.528110 g.528110  ORF g.528110 m.528110 type:complete len:100 (-) comp22015_c0_seq14:963-1262(-)